MNRLLPCLLVWTALSLVAAKPNDPPAPFGPGDPSPPKPGRATHPLPPWLRLPPSPPKVAVVVNAENNHEPAPEEQVAVRAALTAASIVWYDNDGRVKRIDCRAASDAAVRQIATLPHLGNLTIEGPKITDAGLAPLVKATKLRTQGFVNTQISNSGLKVVGQMTQVESLWFGLANPQITGAGMKHLAGRSTWKTSTSSVLRSRTTDCGTSADSLLCGPDLQRGGNRGRIGRTCAPGFPGHAADQ